MLNNSAHCSSVSHRGPASPWPRLALLQLGRAGPRQPRRAETHLGSAARMRLLRAALLLAVCCAAVAAPARRSNSPSPAPKERKASSPSPAPKELKASSPAPAPVGAPQPAPAPRRAPAPQPAPAPGPSAAPSKAGSKKDSKVNAKDIKDDSADKLRVQAEDWLPASSSLPAGPVVASLKPPRGMPAAVAPQFILLAHMGAVGRQAYDLIGSVTGTREINGCLVRGTMFATLEGTMCTLVNKLYGAGFEVADFTDSGATLAGLDQLTMRDRIATARTKLAQCVGIREDSIVGFRAPFLHSSPMQRMVLYNNRFLYDSSLIEDGTGRSMSKGMSQRLWPFDMVDGIPINCGLYNMTQQCDSTEKYDGLFEVPVWQLTAEGGPFTTNPGGSGGPGVYDVLKANFDAAYLGNRAPMPISVTSDFLSVAGNRAGLSKFIEYASSKPNTYFVTYRQAIAWMRNPISTKELSPAALGCGNPGGAPATPQQLAMLMQPPSPPADTAMPDARDSGSDGGNGGGGNKNTVKMPPMGVRISMTIGGVDLDTFRAQTAPQLLTMLHQRLVGYSNKFQGFIVSITPVPAGVTLAGRRRLRASEGTWLQVVAIMPGDSPFVLYQRAQKAIKDGALGSVMALSGGYVVPPTTVVPFKSGMDLDPLGDEAAAAGGADGSSGSGSDNGTTVGLAVGLTVGLVALFGGLGAFAYFKWWRPRRHAKTDAGDDADADAAAAKPRVQWRWPWQWRRTAVTDAAAAEQQPDEPKPEGDGGDGGESGKAPMTALKRFKQYLSHSETASQVSEFSPAPSVA